MIFHLAVSVKCDGEVIHVYVDSRKSHETAKEMNVMINDAMPH